MNVFTTYHEWRAAITGPCGLTLDRSYCELRIAALLELLGNRFVGEAPEPAIGPDRRGGKKGVAGRAGSPLPAQLSLLRFKQLIDCHFDVFGDLAKKRWSHISSPVVRNCGLPSVGVFELVVRTLLSNQ